MRVVGIIAPFATLGVGIRGKFVLSSPREEMGKSDLCRVHLAAVHHGRAVSVFGENSFHRETLGTRREELPCG